jgi:UDP-N-acetylglucosamine diphosphorylase/glucosamine-1-phosphate N-acetyltransferase
MAKLVIYEDDGAADLLPLVYLRPVFSLRCGAGTLLEKIQSLYPREKPVLWVRDHLREVARERYPGFRVNEASAVESDTVLAVNGRALLREKPALKGEACAFHSSEGLVAVRMGGKQFLEKARQGVLSSSLSEGQPGKAMKAQILRYPWNFVRVNGEEIKRDFQALRKGRSGFLDKRAVVYGKRTEVYVALGARVEAGVVLNATSGPIWIDRDAVIRGPSAVDGPCYIGQETWVEGARIRSGVSIGRICRIGGELNESILSDFDNKQHDGFLGHAYLGEWVNLGAGTTNSDLKNNYGEVVVYLGGRGVRSHETKVGCFIGDHTKTAIGTLLNTGAVIGMTSNVFGGDVRKFLPSFVWGNSPKYSEHQVDKAIETARVVMSRRGAEMSKAYEMAFRKAFEMTREERRKSVKD